MTKEAHDALKDANDILKDIVRVIKEAYSGANFEKEGEDELVEIEEEA